MKHLIRFLGPGRWTWSAPRLSRLVRDRTGVALTEFALVLPLLLLLGLVGIDLARLAMINMQVSQIALSLADNASRLGQTENSAVAPTIREADVDAVIDGAIREGGSIDLLTNGRVIISSLEYEKDVGRQYIHWQRCRGQLPRGSAYGNDTDRNGLSGPMLTGLGKGTKVSVSGRTAVMFVEIYYRYEALLDLPYGLGEKLLHREGAFLIRDDRNLGPGLTGSSSRSPC